MSTGPAATTGGAPLPTPEGSGLHRAVFLAAPDGIVVVDPDGAIREVNPRMETLFGYERRELVGRKVEILVPDSVRGVHAGHRKHFVEHPTPRPMGIGMELRGRRKDGTEFPVEISLSPVPGEGGMVIAMVRDVTERKRLREFGVHALRVTEEERKRLARELHDDTGQRLATLLLRLRAARKEGDPARRDELLDELREEIQETAENVRQIARGLRPPALADAGVGAALRSHVRRVVEPVEMEVELDLAPVEDVLSEDAALVLYRVVQEALSNVLRHAEASRVEVRLVREGGRVVAEVVDDGRGFDPAAPRVGGAGLGLLGMRERAAAVGGDVRVESRSGGGTRVRITLPTEEEVRDDGEARRG